MDESINKGIMIAIGLIATLIIGSLIFVGVRYGRNMANSSFQKAANMSEQAEMEEYTSYIGTTISGNQVTSLISQWAQYELCIKVKTKKGTTEYNYKSSGNDLGDAIPDKERTDALTKAKSKKENTYINPNGKFEVSATANDNGVYNVIEFNQQ